LFYVLIMASVLSTGALATAAWLFYSVPEIVALTRGLMDFCQSVLVWCVGYSSIVRVTLLWTGGVALAGGFLYASTRCVASYLRARGALKRLPLRDAGGAVVLIRDATALTAFTHGLLNPRIYLSAGLLEGLTGEEKRAVFLHELCHRKGRDPLRFLLFNFLRDMFFYAPALRCLADRVRAGREYMADDAAASTMEGRLSLASAIIKVTASNTTTLAHLEASLGGVRPGSIVEDRVMRLVEGGEPRLRPVSFRNIAVSLSAAAVILFPMTMTMGAAMPEKRCTTEHCSVHVDRLGEDCKAHCKVSSHRH
jgi:hypothetical protein